MSDSSDHENVNHPVAPEMEIDQGAAAAAAAATAAPSDTAAPKGKKFTVTDVFGDDEDSDLSSDEEAPVRRRAASFEDSSSDSEGDDDDDDDAVDSYRPEKGQKRTRAADNDEQGADQLDATTSSQAAAAPSSRRKRKASAAGGEGGRKKKSKPPVRTTRINSDGEQVEVEQEEEEEVDESTARKRALDARIDAIGKTAKRRTKKRADEGDDLLQDKQVEDITRQMRNAVNEDIQLNAEKRPAIRKTILLPKVMEVMQNASLQDSLLENSEFLSELTSFIEPLKDGALPSLTIQKSILGQLGKFDVIDKDILKASGLGKIVNFYTRTKRVQPDITRQANLLIDKWSKPILRAAGVSVGGRGGINASGGGGDDEQDYASGGANSRDRGVVTMSAKEAKRRDEMRQGTVPVGEETLKTRRPQTIGHSYTTAPPSRRIARSTEEQEREDARQRQLELQAGFRKKAMLGALR